MGAGHGHTLHYHGHSLLHRMPAHLKVVAVLGFVLAVVATPPEQYWAFAVHAALVGAAVIASRVPVRYLAARLVIEVPFLGFAALMPFVSTGPRVDVLGLSLSSAGLLGGWALVAKGTLGVLASLVLATTTEPRDLLRGLERLRLPRQLTQIMGFMVRYVDVVGDEMRRMRVARESRGFSARSPRHWGVLAQSAGALFIRAYERGERVHLAMLSRGYSGTLPAGHDVATTRADAARAAILPGCALLVALLAVQAMR
ncbi:MAG TPA: cobalt ECF transporter T component CbiQ [Candidatus Lustribacter sp.]|nr:cobalt ECF transporter T component CbiQ [Candidatus Lustribacter sp.]